VSTRKTSGIPYTLQWGCEGTHRGNGELGCPRRPHHHHDERCNGESKSHPWQETYIVDKEAWDQFIALMERPPQVKPRLRDLFKRGSVFDRPIDPFAEGEPDDPQPPRRSSK